MCACNYKHAKRARNAFKLKEVRLHNMQDGLTSLAVNIDFMKKMSGKFDSSPSKFGTRASFSWDCALKITKTELELLTNDDMILVTKTVLGEE